MAAASLTVSRLRELLHYDPETGVFVNLVQRGPRGTVGAMAGGVNGKGYIDIQIDGRSYRAQRLAWLYVHGSWPVGHVDHRNEIKTDNRIANLRDATPSVNMQNRRRARSDSTTGRMGVHPWKGRFIVYIWVRGSRDSRRKYVGVFDDQQLAQRAYLAAKRELHPGYIP